MPAATALPAASSTSVTTTVAPSAASLRAVAAPIPCAAPVITATRPAILRHSVIASRLPLRCLRLTRSTIAVSINNEYILTGVATALQD